MKKIRKQVEDYLNYCEKVRGMSPATMWAKRNILKRFIEVTKIRNLEELDNSVFNEWVENEKRRGVSARSIGDIDVSIIMKKLGGGGHASNAACQIENSTIKDIKQKIIELIKE